SAPSYDDLTSVLESSTIDPQLLTPASPNASNELPSTPSSITSLDMSGFLSIEADKALLGDVDELIRFIPQPTTESLSRPIYLRPAWITPFAIGGNLRRSYRKKSVLITVLKNYGETIQVLPSSRNKLGRMGPYLSFQL
ncbi:MAG: hypothetical protein M1830_004493, partial [Pleopsidium flavum]